MAIVYPGGTGVTDKNAAALESGGFKFVGTHPTSAAGWETDYSDVRDAITANPGGSIGSGTAATGLAVDGAATFNESGADVDFRIEGDTDTDLLVCDAGNDSVGIGIAADSQTAKLHVDGDLRLEMHTDNVSDPPTTAELNSALGSASTVGAGYMALLDDNNAGSDVYLCVSTGSNWGYVKMTLAGGGA